MESSKKSLNIWKANSSKINKLWIEDLKFILEEEKLARDVYFSLYDVWGVSILKNIVDSEQLHTDSVDKTLTKYGIEVPVKSDVI